MAKSGGEHKASVGVPAVFNSYSTQGYRTFIAVPRVLDWAKDVLSKPSPAYRRQEIFHEH
jgi:hypothetical protein